MPDAGNKYHREIHGLPSQGGGTVIADVYRVDVAFEVSKTHPALGHALKKLLCAGRRNKGSQIQDLEEAVVCVSRAIEDLRVSG